MHRAARFSLITVSALLLVVAGAFLYLNFADLNVWIDDIERKVSESSGYDVAINGLFELDFGTETAATLSAITISKPGETAAAPFTSIANFHIVLDTWSLLRGPVRISGLDLSDADIELRIDADGVDNWQPDTTEVTDSAGGEAPLLDRIRLDDIRISYSDESASDAATLNRATLDHAELSFADERINIADSRTALDAGGVAVKGQISLGEADKPRLELAITSERLEFRPAPPEEETLVVDAAQSDDNIPARMFSDEPLEESWLNALNLDMKIVVQQLSLGAETVEDFDTTITIDNGTFSAAPLTFKKGTGEFSGEVGLEPHDDEFLLNLSFVARQIRLGALAAEGQDPGTVPPLDLTVDLTGSGRTMHEIAASSSGQLSGMQQSGLVNMQNSGFLFSDIVTSVFRTINPLAESEPFAELECSIIDVKIDDGVATINELAAQLDRLMIIGSGNINLDTEELDLTIRTKTREGLGLSLGGVVNSLLAVGGTISEPALNIDPAGSITTAGAAVATGGMSVLAKGLWDRLSAETDICKKAAD